MSERLNTIRQGPEKFASMPKVRERMARPENIFVTKGETRLNSFGQNEMDLIGTIFA